MQVTRTPASNENPTRALDILETDRAPADAGLAVAFADASTRSGRSPITSGTRRRSAWSDQLFQMTMTTVTPGGPVLAIVK